MKMKKEVKEHKPKGPRITGNSLGASGFTLGVLSILFLNIFSIIFSLVGFAFCFIQQQKKPTKLGKAGIIVNIVGLVLTLIMLFWLGPKLTELMSSFPVE